MGTKTESKLTAWSAENVSVPVVIGRKLGANFLNCSNLSIFFSFPQNKDAGDSDSEKEQEELNELENLLKKHDPDFSK